MYFSNHLDSKGGCEKVLALTVSVCVSEVQQMFDEDG
jgi:hypothetical protein